jgi:hypothetical protein
MRSLLALLTVALLSMAATACGGADKGASSASQTAAGASETAGTKAASATRPTSGATSSPSTAGKAEGYLRDTNDGDDDPGSNDDIAIFDYGHAANAADERAITALLTSYYAAGAAADGAAACKLIYSLIAETIPEEFTSPALRGPTCAAVMSKVLKQRQRQLIADNAALKVTRVRVEGSKGLALVNLGRTPEPHLLLHREGGAWRVESLSESGMP